MIYIAKNEFYASFKSLKSLLIILFFSVTSFLSARFFSQNEALLTDLGNASSAYTSSIKLLLFVFGFIFVFSISHDMINKELEMQTIRLLVTKVKRVEIIIGKVLGGLLFWVCSLTCSFIIVSIYAKSWFWTDFAIVLIFIFFVISFVTLLSTVIPRPTYTMFLGIFLGIVLPIVGFASTINDHWALLPFKFILPYHYIVESGPFLLIPIVIAIGFVYLSYLYLRGRDL